MRDPDTQVDKSRSQADFVVVIYVLLGILPYIAQLSFAFQELDFDVAIAQVLVNHCLSPPEGHRDGRHHGMRKSPLYVTCNECKLL